MRVLFNYLCSLANFILNPHFKSPCISPGLCNEPLPFVLYGEAAEARTLCRRIDNRPTETSVGLLSMVDGCGMRDYIYLFAL